MTAQATIGAPALIWQSRQWQIETRSGAALSSYRIAPHWQPPVMAMTLSPHSFMLCSKCHWSRRESK
jgi:hypothetical protein